MVERSSKVIQYYKQHLSIAKAVGNRSEEGRAYCNLGITSRRLGDLKQAMPSNTTSKNFALPRSWVTGLEKGLLMAIWGMLIIASVTSNKPYGTTSKILAFPKSLGIGSAKDLLMVIWAMLIIAWEILNTL